MKHLLKLLGITLGLGISFAWMFGGGMVYGLHNAFGQIAHACHMHRTTIDNGQHIIDLLGAFVAIVIFVAVGVETFRYGSAPPLEDFGAIHFVVACWLLFTTAVILAFIPFWLGCSILFLGV
jgi:hypothetical protein